MPQLFPTSDIETLIKTGGSTRVDKEVKGHFAPGDKVYVKNINPLTHTRLPRYVRGKVGTIDRDHGVFVFPDTNAELQGEKPQHVYSVVFSAQELWGSRGAEQDKLYIDLWEDYIEPARRG